MRMPSSRSAGLADTPFALVEKQRGAIRLVMPDPQACALGLTPGLALADARARVPDLAVIEADPAADQDWIERIADLCDRYTPMVAIDPPDGLTLDLTGCLHPFGGEAALAADLEGRVRHWSGHLRLAFADTPEAAQALARFQGVPAASEAAALRRLDVAALRLPGETVAALRRAGLKTIGDLAARPTAPIVARFGAEATAVLARLLGTADSRIRPRRPLPSLVFERRFAEPIARVEDALHGIGELARDAAAALLERHEGGRRFAVRLFRSDGAVRDLAIETGLPSRDPAVLARLFRERIDALADPIDPGFGFDMIRLAVPATEPLGALQLPLEGGAIGEEAMAALLDRLGARLGRGRVRRFGARDTHIPEQGAFALPVADGPAVATGWPAPEPGEPPQRPILLFDPPQRVEAIAQVPDGPPHRFRWRRSVHEVARSEGPERIAAEWWRHADGRGLTRDYYRVEDTRGRRFWIFRHGLYGQEKALPDWYVHGLFA